MLSLHWSSAIHKSGKELIDSEILWCVPIEKVNNAFFFIRWFPCATDCSLCCYAFCHWQKETNSIKSPVSKEVFTWKEQANPWKCDRMKVIGAKITETKNERSDLLSNYLYHKMPRKEMKKMRRQVKDEKKAAKWLHHEKAREWFIPNQLAPTSFPTTMPSKVRTTDHGCQRTWLCSLLYLGIRPGYVACYILEPVSANVAEISRQS